MNPKKKPVKLDVPTDVAARYEDGAEVLRQEVGLPEISSDLLMLVCLAAPQVDDLVLGFLRDDLQVVSLDDQTRRVMDRDIAAITVAATRRVRLTPGSLARQIMPDHRRADASANTSDLNALDGFIAANPDAFRRVAGMTSAELARWVMLALMREMEGRRRSHAIIQEWKLSLGRAARTALDQQRLAKARRTAATFTAG